MNKIISGLREHATFIAQHRAIEDEKVVLTYRQFLTMVEQVAARLTIVSPQVVAILADNGIASVVADLAAMSLGMLVVSLPAGLSQKQLRDVLRNNGVDCVLTDRPDDITKTGIEIAKKTLPIVGELFEIQLVVDTHAAVKLPLGTAKVFFGAAKPNGPRKFCFGHAELEFAAESLLGAAASMQGDRHLCLSPLSTSHESIGGIYTSILAGATIGVPQLKNVGILGTSIRIDELIASLETWRATSVSTSPKILQSLVVAAQNGIVVPNTIRYVAVADAFPAALLVEAHLQRIPVYAGCAFVESMATVNAHRRVTWLHGNVENSRPRISVDLFDNPQFLRSRRRNSLTKDDTNYSAAGHPTPVAKRRLR